MTGSDGRPHSVLPASQVVRMLVPTYVQDDPSLAGVLSESMADRVADKLKGKTVRSLVREDPPELAVVMADGRLVGVITASRLLQLALTR